MSDGYTLYLKTFKTDCTEEERLDELLKSAIDYRKENDE